ncbi:hypothetical protein [Gimesia fumaroli]|uniref:Uncharacterized protein n=1 Tax=Gimesia fumaroli TaxID=2527976 RepID=A0A518I920_9PLAN|nr:hypothetical protein [Gimesia fumaroli]QDV49601.1 hypothetical protein Enr17x_16210 [Gimesia fumaroli]
MAQLDLTKEEALSMNILTWDDASIGRAVKKLGLDFYQETNGRSALMYSTCAIMLIAEAVKQGAFASVIDVDHSNRPVNPGKWRITLERIGD